MANALYDKARAAFEEGSINLLTATIKVVGSRSSGYTPNLATDQFLSDIPSGARAATSAALTSKTDVGGAFDADDAVLSAVPAGADIDQLVLYKDTGTAGTSPLIGFIDNATNLPVTPNGGDINIQWDNGANKILKL